MTNSFIAAASRPVTSVNQFLRDSSENSVKYKAESGKRHQLYIPFMDSVDETGKPIKSVVAISREIHDMTPEEGKYEVHICLRGLEVKGSNGEILNDGTCPFCERVKDSWDIFNYQIEKLTQRAMKSGMQGKELEDYIKNARTSYSRNLKIKAGRNYIYMLVVQYKLGVNNMPEIGTDGLPVFELKVMKLSAAGIEKIKKSFETAGLCMEGSEVVFEYPQEADIMQVVNHRTVSPVYNNGLIIQYPALRQAIDAAVSKWTWDGIDSAFREWEPISVDVARHKCDEIFKSWDEYKAGKTQDYLTGSSNVNAGTPEIETKAVPNTPVATNMPIGTPNTPVATNMPIGTPNVQMQQGFTNQPQLGFGGNFDPNAVFGNGNIKL